jgi:hypothetical protein
MDGVRLSREAEKRASELSTAIQEIDAEIREASPESKPELMAKRGGLQSELNSILPPAVEPLRRP